MRTLLRLAAPSRHLLCARRSAASAPPALRGAACSRRSSHTRPMASAAAPSAQPAAAQQQQPVSVLICNGAQRPCSQRAGEWLAAAPRGAYTTARTVGDGTLVLKLSSHISRLAESANLMVAADEQAAGNDVGAAPRFALAELRPRFLQCMGAAIAAARAAAAATGSTSAGSGGAGSSSGQPAGEPQQLKLTVLMTWGGAAAEGAPGGYDLWCHAEPLPPRPRPPVKLVFRGLPRSNARAKDSEWVRERKALESDKPADVNEVVLVAPDGAAMEGLTSNFYALHRGALVTAGEGVLGGTIREIVLEVCEELGVPVQLQPPNLADASAWDAAFISSTSRLLLPADELRWRADDHAAAAGGGGGRQGAAAAADAQGECARRFEGQCELASRLEAAVAARIIADSEPVPLP